MDYDPFDLSNDPPYTYDYPRPDPGQGAEPHPADAQERPYITPDINALDEDDHRWRNQLAQWHTEGHADGPERRDRKEIQRDIYWAKYHHAEGQVALRPDKAPPSTSQADAAKHVASALSHLDHLASGHPDFRYIAQDMVWEVARMRTPSLSRVPDVATRPEEITAWDYLFEPANLRGLASAAVAQLGGNEAKAWEIIRNEGLTSSRFTHLLEHYTGVEPFGWQQQVTGHGAVIPVEVAERLSFIVQVEAAMHVANRTQDRNSFFNIMDPRLADSNPGKQPPADPSITARLRNHQHMLKMHAYGVPQAEHHHGDTQDSFYIRRKAQLSQYIHNVERVQDPRWRNALQERALAQLRPINARFAAQAAAEREAQRVQAQQREGALRLQQEERARQERAEHRERARERLAQIRWRKQQRDAETELRLKRETTEYAKRAANAAEEQNDFWKNVAAAAARAADAARARNAAAQREPDGSDPNEGIPSGTIVDSGPVEGEWSYDSKLKAWVQYRNPPDAESENGQT